MGPGSAEMMEQLTRDVQELRRALEDARTNARRQPMTSEAACNTALDRLYRLEERFPELQRMLQRRENARKQQNSEQRNEQRIRKMEQRVAEQQRDLDALREKLNELTVIHFRKRDAG
jgi:predicted RNase H-like nuclease (RuvC/YqgF family)